MEVSLGEDCFNCHGSLQYRFIILNKYTKTYHGGFKPKQSFDLDKTKRSYIWKHMSVFSYFDDALWSTLCLRCTKNLRFEQYNILRQWNFLLVYGRTRQFTFVGLAEYKLFNSF